MSNIATSIVQSKHLLELGLDPKTADMWWSNRFVYWKSTPMIGVATEQNQLYTFKWCEMDVPAWSLSALLEVMPKPDLYRETADLWVCVAFFKEGSIRGFGETAIDAACDNITKMFERGYLKKKGGEQ